MSREEISCSLVIPGLLDLPTAECKAAFAAIGRLPELELFFTRAEQSACGRAGLEATLFELFGVPVESHNDVPVAAASYQADSKTAVPGFCMRADPVHLMPDRDQLVLVGPESLDLSAAEAERLVHELNTFFAEDGWRIEAPTPERWYLHIAETPELRTYDLEQVRGQSINAFLPRGAHGKHWHGVMNEIQMLLHSSSVNLERQASGKLPVSSLWFWGSGELPTMDIQKDGRWSGVWTNEVLSTGLALLTGAPEHKLPDNAQDWLVRAKGPGEHLLLIDDLLLQWQQHDEAAWQQAVQSMQKEWLMPLLEALRKRTISRLTIYTTNGKSFSLTRRRLKHWWRGRRSLLKLCD